MQIKTAIASLLVVHSATGCQDNTRAACDADPVGCSWCIYNYTPPLDVGCFSIALAKTMTWCTCDNLGTESLASTAATVNTANATTSSH